VISAGVILEVLEVSEEQMTWTGSLAASMRWAMQAIV
jgi:hypothetical protein